MTVFATTTPGSATSGSDYVGFNGTVTINPGDQTASVPIPIVNDSLDEDPETFTVTLSSPSANATIANGTRTFTIADNDTTSALDVNDPASVTEPGSGGSAVVTFTVTLSPASARTVTVPYATVNGTATAGSDYTAASGTLTFLPGETQKTVPVTVLGDAVAEPNEGFTLKLGAVTGARVADGEGLALIVDPTAPPSLTITDAVVDEGAGSVTLTVSLAGNATAQTVTVDYAAASGTATSGTDFAATSGTLSFAPGTTSKPIVIPITNDTTGEADETFTVTLSNPVGATLSKSKATVRIVDNDPVPGGSGTPAGTPKPTTPPATTPPTTTPKPPPPTPTVRTLQVKLVWVKLAGKVDGKPRAAIRVSLAQKVSAKVVMLQGKRKISSGAFDLLRGNRTVYVVLPAFVKPGKVQLQLVMTTVAGSTKTLKTSVTLKAPVKKAIAK